MVKYLLVVILALLTPTKTEAESLILKKERKFFPSLKIFHSLYMAHFRIKKSPISLNFVELE